MATLLLSHCRGRTQLYHTLLHYKLRLLLEVRARLRAIHASGGRASARAVSGDSALVKRETDRLDRLLAQAGSRWGDREDFNRVSTC
jgi:hypothetical protein